MEGQAGAPGSAPDKLFGADGGVVQSLVIKLRPPAASLQIDILMTGGDMQAAFVEPLPPAALDAGMLQNDRDIRHGDSQGMHPERIIGELCAVIGDGVTTGRAGMITQ